MVTFLFWFSVLMIFYAYFGYPVGLMLILGFRKIKVLLFSKAYQSNGLRSEKLVVKNRFPLVSFIITAYNEEKRITEKIDNTLAQDYPADRIEILVASDCSNDRTDEIVSSYCSQGIKLVRAPERKGKENAQKHAVDASTGEILIFSDVATILEPDAVSRILENFSDPTVGCVSSVDKFIDKDGKISGEGAYVAYEMFLRNLETQVNTLVGLSGSFFAARSEVCHNWQVDLQSDFNTLLNSIRLGMRGVSDLRSIGYYHNISDEKREFNRKVRTVLRGISVLMRNRSLLNPAKFGLFSWQLFSHKLCRWLVPIFMIVAYIANAVLLGASPLYWFFFILQNLFYASAFYYHKRRHTKEDRSHYNRAFQSPVFSKLSALSKMPYFFTLVNFSVLVSWWKYIKGERATFWEPSER